MSNRAFIRLRHASRPATIGCVPAIRREDDPMTLGVPPGNLGDQERERELEHTHAQRHDTFLNGTSHALSTHTRWMFELELEHLRRFPDRVREDALKLDRRP
jgi:hypothetical protein